MLSMDASRLSAPGAFWRGSARTFDLFGLLYDHEGPSADPAAARRADQQALADDWKAVFNDLADAWMMLKPELDSERARAL